jgi:hypothetical protein
MACRYHCEPSATACPARLDAMCAASSTAIGPDTRATHGSIRVQLFAVWSIAARAQRASGTPSVNAAKSSRTLRSNPAGVATPRWGRELTALAAMACWRPLPADQHATHARSYSYADPACRGAAFACRSVGSAQLCATTAMPCCLWTTVVASPSATGLPPLLCAHPVVRVTRSERCLS